jgi:hypothetical protein
MWPLKKLDGPEPEITPEMAFGAGLTMILFWWLLQMACPWLGTPHIPGVR